MPQHRFHILGGDAGVGAGADKSRRFSIVSISVGTGRGGAAGGCTFGSNRFNNVSRSANPSEGVATAAIIRSASITAGSLTVHTGRCQFHKTRRLRQNIMQIL